MTVDPSKFENLAAKYSQAIFSTNMGNFTLKFYSDKAPQTVMNFMNLANIGYYNGVKFHRVIPDFMIQGGDQLTKDDSLQSSWGTGGPGYAIKDEFGPGLSNVRGTISMANAGVNTGGSQFFVNVADNTYLDGKHAVFGEVTEGMDVVDAISKAATGDANRPITPIVINSIVLK
ncbi:MAG: peptidylprolyl isomerase [Candidatus Falkowbacteria bacterium]|nr:peptidylprolyl isomerase [Candidatus Falkowbacteria bacterium]